MTQYIDKKKHKVMIQEEKELLLKDLCARLPYHPIVYVDENLPRLKLGVATRVWEYIAVDKPCKPYLRPMSSMTEEEKKEHHNLCYEEEREEFEFGEWVTRVYYHDTIESIDWLNKNHFDYRGLIEKGLAIEVNESNNPYKD
jgi:hypothetical protein